VKLSILSYPGVTQTRPGVLIVCSNFPNRKIETAVLAGTVIKPGRKRRNEEKNVGTTTLKSVSTAVSLKFLASLIRRCSIAVLVDT
jgi:hypothetical protein